MTQGLINQDIARLHRGAVNQMSGEKLPMNLKGKASKPGTPGTPTYGIGLRPGSAPTQRPSFNHV